MTRAELLCFLISTWMLEHPDATLTERTEAWTKLSKLDREALENLTEDTLTSEVKCD